MRLRVMVVAAGAVWLLATGYATAETAQQQKMTSCNAEASEKGLKGADRKAFMKSCLSAGSEASAAKPLTAQQEKMKSCNKEASAQGLKGAARKTFMSSCLSAK